MNTEGCLWRDLFRPIKEAICVEEKDQLSTVKGNSLLDSEEEAERPVS